MLYSVGFMEEFSEEGQNILKGIDVLDIPHGEKLIIAQKSLRKITLDACTRLVTLVSKTELTKLDFEKFSLIEFDDSIFEQVKNLLKDSINEYGISYTADCLNNTMRNELCTSQTFLLMILNQYQRGALAWD